MTQVIVVTSTFHPAVIPVYTFLSAFQWMEFDRQCVENLHRSRFHANLRSLRQQLRQKL